MWVDPESRARAAPFLKWVGSKRHFTSLVAPCIFRRLSRDGGRYFEPFLGGGAVALDLGLGRTAKDGPPRMVLGDINAQLVNAWMQVKDDVDGVIVRLKALGIADGYTEEAYDNVRRRFNLGRAYMFDGAWAAKFLYLNALCHAGIYRENKKGEFNVPFGHFPDQLNYRRLPSPETLRAASEALRSADIRRASFEATLGECRSGDVALLDSPYDNTFVGYTEHGFNEDRQRELARVIVDLMDRGAHVVAFNSDSPLIRELYTDARLSLIPSREGRAVSRSKGEGQRPAASCLLITNDCTLLGD